MSQVVEFVPVRTAARVLGVSVQRVHQLILADKLRARRYDRTWLVAMTSIKARYEDRKGRA